MSIAVARDNLCAVAIDYNLSIVMLLKAQNALSRSV